MKNRHHALVTATLIAASMLPAAAPVLASDVTGRDVTVHYADLNTGTVDGATQLLQRIESAADRVCSPLDHGDLVSRSHREACKQKLVSAAVARVNSSVLAGIYQATGRSPSRVIAQTM